MSTPVTINGTIYNIPSQSQSPPWGDDLHDLLVAITTQAASVSGPSDIPVTSFTVANNIASVANVTGLFFDPTLVRGAIVDYSIYRSSSTTELSETGQMMLTYKSTAGTWELAPFHTGSSGVVFSITNAGQVQYTSSNFGGISYVGKMKFSAKSMLQA